MGELADQIMQRAWAELPNPGVAPAFARAALARLKRHEELVKERREVFEATGEPAFSERLALDDRRRRLLLGEMIELLKSDRQDAYYLVSWKTTLVATGDVEWLIGRLRTESCEGRKAAVAALIGQTYRLWDDEAEELVYLAHLEDETLAREVGRFFAPVELGSEHAEEQRRSHERFSRWEKEDEEPPPDPPVSARVLGALDDFEAGDVEAFWQGVYHFMQYDGRGFGSVSGAEWDMTGLPGWEAAADGTKARIVEAAKRYVLEGDPRTVEWFGNKDITYRPAFAGYRALCLLLRFAPEFLEGLSADVWEKWTPIILDFPVTLNAKEEKDSHLRLVAMAYDRAPDRLISTLLALIDQEDTEGHLFVTRSLERCWDDRLARAVLEKAKDPKLKARTLGALLGDLLGQGSREARDYAEELASSGPRGDEDQLERAAVVAGVLFFFAEDCGWGVLWPAMQEDDAFADAVVDEVCSGVRRSDLPFKHLNERQVAELYVWMAKRYPRSEYCIEWGHGMVTYGRKENISEWRDEAVTHLRDRGTFEACRQIRRIMEELPELRETLKWTLDAARTQARRQTWLPPTPERVLALAARPEARPAEDVGRVARQEHCPIGELLGPPPKEAAHLEYKATFRTRAEEGKNGEPVGEVFKPLETASLKTIAAFLNSREGGTLLIGVGDDGSVYGLESDYATLRSEKRADKDDRDLFGLHVNQAVMNSVGPAAAANVGYEILEVGGKDLCRVHVRPSRFPVEARVTWVDGRGQHRKKVAFYGRFGNATRSITDEAELERYKQQIWGYQEDSAALQSSQSA